jgi:threonyl-tRNA synthetase
MANKLTSSKIRVDIDDRNESIGKRIREAETEWIQYILVIGEKEVNAKDLSIRNRETGELKQLVFEEFVKEIIEQICDKPFSGLNSNRYLSSRPQIMV